MMLISPFFDYRFQFVLGLDSAEKRERLCVNTLSNFRCRLVEYEMQTGRNLIQEEMEELAENMAEFFSLNTSLARMDSTMIDIPVKKRQELNWFIRLPGIWYVN